MGSVGDSYDNALAETIFGLYKTEVIRRRGPWRNLEEVEYATLEWVDWFNHRRLFEPIGNIPPVEFEQLYYQCQEGPVMEAGLKHGVSEEPGAVHHTVRKWCGECFAPSAAPSYRPTYPTGHAGAAGLGYDPKILDAAPSALVEAFCGVGTRSS